MQEFDEYQAVFQTDYEVKNPDLNAHIEKLKLIDELLPPNNTFTVITRAAVGQIDFIGKNFEYATGHNSAEFLEGGIKKYLKYVHPEDVGILLQILKDLMDYAHENYSVEDFYRLDFQYNYRLKSGNHEYLNIVENHVAIIADESGMPHAGLGHFTVIGSGSAIPMQATLKLLNDKDEYETVYHRNYGTRLLESKISSRERDIIRLIAMGHNNEFISDKLSISPHTVRTHRKNLLQKTNVKNTTELVVHCLREGLI